MVDDYLLRSLKTQMGAFLQKLLKRNMTIYQPDQWAKRLGERCDQCGKNLTHEGCISLCKCYYFCHRQCFIIKYEQQIYDETADVICNRCQQSLGLNLKLSYKYEPEFSYKKFFNLVLSLFLVLLCVLLMVLTLYSSISMEIIFLLLYFQGLILTLLLYRLMLSIRDLLFRKVISIKEVVSTHLDIQTSAFKDIEFETHDEITKECLIQSKK